MTKGDKCKAELLEKLTRAFEDFGYFDLTEDDFRDERNQIQKLCIARRRRGYGEVFEDACALFELYFDEIDDDVDVAEVGELRVFSMPNGRAELLHFFGDDDTTDVSAWLAEHWPSK